MISLERTLHSDTSASNMTIEITREIKSFLATLGIADHPGLRVNATSEGYRDFTFGCRAGPSEPNVHDLAHELAHAAQFGVRNFAHRAPHGSFRFKLRHIVIGRQHCVDPLNCNAIKRELDTFAYQVHLMEQGGVMVDHDTFFARAGKLMIDFMHDWLLVPGNDEAERIDWCIEHARACYRRRRPETAKRRLVEWLDATAAHLAQQAQQT